MKKLIQKVASTGVATIMLFGTFQTSVLATKTDVGTSVSGIKGWSGNAVMVESPLKTNDKAVKLDNGNAAWKFVNDMDTEVSYSGKIVVSADFYAEIGETLTFLTGGADITVTGTGKWDTVSVLLDTITGKYETFVNKTLTGNGTMTKNTAITGVSFATSGLFYIDNIKAEQYDKVYAENELDTVLSENFDGLNNGTINKQNGWVDEEITNNKDEGREYNVVGDSSGKYIEFVRTEAKGEGYRLYHDFEKTTKDIVFSARFKAGEITSADGMSAKMDIMIRQKSGISVYKNFIGPHIHLQYDSYWGGTVYVYGAKIQYTYLYDLGEWVDVKLVVNTEDGNYNLFVNGKKINDAPLPYQEAIGTEYTTGGKTTTFDTSGFDKLELDAYPDTIGTWYMDDLKIGSAKDVVRYYTTVFEDDFENGFDVRAYDSSTDAKWRYSRQKVNYDDIWNANGSDNAKYVVATPGEKLGTDLTTAQTNVLNIESLKNRRTDLLPEYRPDGTTRAYNLTSTQQQQIWADFAGGASYSKNFRISADVYTANYFYDKDDNARQDMLYLYLGNGSYHTYISMSDGGLAIDKATDKRTKASDISHTQNAWNKLVVDIDNNSVMTVSMNGNKSTDSTYGKKTLTSGTNSIGFATRTNNGGWYYIDNVKVETYEDRELKTDLTKGISKKLIENNIDEMYKHSSADMAYTVEGIYYTRDGGKSVESKPRSADSNNAEVKIGGSIEYLLDSVKLIKNEDVSNAVVYAAIYNGGALEKVVGADIPESNIGDTVKVSFLSEKVVCTAETDAKFFVLSKKDIQPYTEKSSLIEENTKTVFIASDSIAAPYGADNYPQKGWGNTIGNFFDRRAIRVENYAAPGRGSKTFYNENSRWNAIKANAKSGDYLLVSFAHNEDKDYAYTNPFGDVEDPESYKYWLNKYRVECEEMGVKMILIAPIPRANWANGKLKPDTLSYYIDAMREFATEYNVPLVDMNTTAKETVTSMGEVASKQLYLVFNPVDYADDSYFASSIYNTEAEVTDTTHLKAAGAEKVAAGIAAGLSRIEGIRDYIK